MQIKINNNNHTSQKGITLIALVITIIVLLILAGVAINLAVDANGLFSRANEAKTEWNNRVDQEGETIQNVLDMANEYIGGNTGGGGITLPDGWDANKVGSVFTDSETNQQAPIPNGFVVSQIPGEDSIPNGLVIYQEEGDYTGEVSGEKNGEAHTTAMENRNQYVWIPVDDINDMIMCSKNGKDEGTDAEGETTKVCHIVLQNGNLVCEVHDNSPELVGRLYTGSLSSKNSDGTYSYPMTFSETTKASQTYTAGSSYREPNTVSSDSSNSVTLDQLQEDFYAMAKSVYTYGGFYISRYEVGENGNSKKNQAILTAATSSGTNYLAGNMWYGLYNTLRKEGTTTTPSYHMIWGSQYDQVIKFIGSEAQTGHSDGRVTTSQSKSGSTTDILKNIYDLEGNCYEWTAEAYNTDSRMCRGAIYDYASNGHFYPAACRTSSVPSITSSTASSRASLYL